jgi:hypothetical protein
MVHCLRAKGLLGPDVALMTPRFCTLATDAICTEIL